MFVRWRRGSGMGFVLRGGVTWWWVWHGSDPSLEKTAWRAADGRALQLLITDGAIKSTTCQTCCCLIDRVWLSLYSLFIFLLSWGCEQKALGCFSTVWSCMWLHGHSTVCKHNLTEAQTPTSVHMCTQREVVDCHRQGKDTSKWYSNLYHYITTATTTSITTSLQNCCDKLPQKPVLCLAVQFCFCCCCCIFEHWRFFRGLQDKGKSSE